jgi:rhodanese-related sulfurtransferase
MERSDRSTDWPAAQIGYRLSMTLTELLLEARRSLVRVNPEQLATLMQRNEVVVLDTRTPTDRAMYGCIPGSIHTPRTVLEWRVALDAPLRIPEVMNHDQCLVVVCNEGFSSSLAAVSLQTLGFHRATDLVGGVLAWSENGLPLEPPRNDELGVQEDLEP